MLDAGGMVDSVAADVALSERLLELVQCRRHGEPEEHADDAEHEDEEEDDRQRLGHPPAAEPLDAGAHRGRERE